MNKFLLASLICILSLVSCNAAKNRIQIINATEHSLVHVQYQVDLNTLYGCTGFIVDSAKGYVLTAQHCVVNEDGKPQEVYVNKIKAEVIKMSDELALIKMPIMVGPPLEFRSEPLQRGDEAIAIGYGYGSETVLVRHVSDPADRFHKGGEDIILDGGLVPGMSGGPILDFDGKVIGISQQNSPNFIISRACGQNEMKAFLKGT